jgi:hypothetical protein
MTFAFIAKHKGIWPPSWLCSARGVSRSGFHAWLTRKPSRRALDDERVGAMARASFLASDRTYGARRVWHDVLADGVDCGLHRIERLMRQGATGQAAATWPAAGPGRAINRRRPGQHPGPPVPGGGFKPEVRSRLHLRLDR